MKINLPFKGVMDIKTLLALRFLIIVASLLFIYSIAVYQFSSYFRQKEFYDRLKEKALSTAKLLLEDKFDSEILKIIDRESFNAIISEKVTIYNDEDQPIYSSDEFYIPASKELLSKIRRSKELEYKVDSLEYVGLDFRYKNQDYVVLSSAYDKYGISKLSNLELILGIGFVGSLILVGISGFIFSRQALVPIADVVRQVDNITVLNLNNKVDEGNGRDEIAQLAITFNKMLKRLEDSFKMQRSFVSHASHEFRTPLTSMKGQIEVHLSQKRTIGEYEDVLHSQLEEINKMIKLSNGLLELAQANADISSMNQKPVRIDEVLYEIRDEILHRTPEFKIDIRFLEFPEEEEKLSVMGVDQLLKSCFKNIIDNGCKYSKNHTVIVTVDFTSQYLEIIVADNGIGISWEDQRQILQPFYRANNSRSIPGHGIGLALAAKIAELHKGRVFVDSELDKGTKVIVYLPFMPVPNDVNAVKGFA